MRYWDSSALIPLLVEEKQSGPIRSILKEDPSIISWWGTSVECFSALCRRWRDRTFNDLEFQKLRKRSSRLMNEVDFVSPSNIVRDRAIRLLATHPLRSADALQLAAALRWIQDETKGVGFVCLDEQLRAAASAEGFTLFPE